MLKWVLIAIGGGLGSTLRYGLQSWVQRQTNWDFPCGTLVVNVLGCAAMGFLAGVFTGPTLPGQEYRLGLTAGLLGGFTTFSAFGWETVHLAHNNHPGSAAMNVGLSCGLGFTAVWISYALAQRWLGA